MSQFHEDYMSKDLCIWPDCDCEIRCDHINCSPPVVYSKTFQCPVCKLWQVEGSVHDCKPRYAVFIFGDGGVNYLPLRWDESLGYWMIDVKRDWFYMSPISGCHNMGHLGKSAF